MRIAYVVDPDVTYFRRVLKGVAQFAGTRGDLELVVEQVRTPERFAAVDRAGYDGLVLGTNADWTEPALRLHTPAVNVSNTNPGPRFPRVVTDDGEVGRMVARHLLAKGFRHFAFWGDERYLFARQRGDGFAEAITAALGRDQAPAWTSRGGRRWLRRMPRPLGLMATHDDTGSEAIRNCHDLGLRVPEDVAVVGVGDDDLYSELTRPPLSSVALPTERIGYLAVECLLRLVAGEEIPAVTLVPPGPLLARQSSRTVATEDELVARAVRFLEENLERGGNVAAAARALGASRKTLELRFREKLGQSPGQELLRLKVERAQSLLATTGLPLKAVAARAGFGTAVRLGRVLQRRTGQTPLEYRRGFLPH
ncbi:MAG: substrate-binding domain-containing protein [Lentisphaeria bacterium]|jgi:LacI family transcriptional regulator